MSGISTDLRVFYEDPLRKRGLVYARTRDALVRWAVSVGGTAFTEGPTGWMGWAGAGLYRLVPNPPTDYRDTFWSPSRILEPVGAQRAEARARAEAAAWVAYADALRLALDEAPPGLWPGRAGDGVRDVDERYEGGGT